MIDKSTGEIMLIDSVRIGPWLSHKQFLSSPLYQGATSLIHNEGWHSYRIEGTSAHQQKLYIMLQFFNSTLKWIDFVAESGAEIDESEQKRMHDQLLEGWLGAGPYEYEWGEAVSSYDPKSDQSSIIISYRNNERGMLSWLLDKRR